MRFAAGSRIYGNGSVNEMRAITRNGSTSGRMRRGSIEVMELTHPDFMGKTKSAGKSNRIARVWPSQGSVNTFMHEVM